MVFADQKALYYPIKNWSSFLIASRCRSPARSWYRVWRLRERRDTEVRQVRLVCRIGGWPTPACTRPRPAATQTGRVGLTGPTGCVTAESASPPTTNRAGPSTGSRRGGWLIILSARRPAALSLRLSSCHADSLVASSLSSSERKTSVDAAPMGRHGPPGLGTTAVKNSTVRDSAPGSGD